MIESLHTIISEAYNAELNVSCQKKRKQKNYFILAPLVISLK